MADEDYHRHVLQGQEGLTHVVEHRIDDASGFTNRVSVTPMVWVHPTTDQELEVHIHILSAVDVLSFELSGVISPRHRQLLVAFLDSCGISSRARNDAIGLIFSLYNTTEEILARVQIEAYYDVAPLDANYDMVLGLSAEDYSLRPTPASRDVLGVLERVSVGLGAVIRETSCAVCLDEFSSRSEVMKMPCSHVFHGGCIGRWLETRSVCPMCRFDLLSTEDMVLDR